MPLGSCSLIRSAHAGHAGKQNADEMRDATPFSIPFRMLRSDTSLNRGLSVAVGEPAGLPARFMPPFGPSPRLPRDPAVCHPVPKYELVGFLQ